MPATQLVPLGDIVEILDNRRIPVKGSERAKRIGNVPYYGATGQVDWIDDYLFDEELVLLGEDGVPFLDPDRPKAYLISGKAWVNNHAHVLRAIEDKVTPSYLCHILNRIDYTHAVTGGTRAKLTQSAMRELLIPLPPIEEQRRVAKLLDEADEIQRLRKEANEKAQRILPALFIDMFGDPDTNPKGWAEGKVSDFASAKGGKRLPKGTPYADSVTAHPYVRAGDIKPNVIRTTELKYISPETHACISRYVVRPNSVLITIAGKIGVAAASPQELWGANMTENAAIIDIADTTEMNPVYLAALLNTDWCQGQIEQATGRVTIGKLALFRIEALRVLVPPIELQHRYAKAHALVLSTQERQAEATNAQDRLDSVLRSRLFAS